MPTLVYTDTEDLDPAAGVRMLEDAGHQVIRLQTRSADDIVRAAEHAQGLLVGYATIDAELLARLPQLEIISLLSVGADNVDVRAATERGISVTTVGGAAALDVASHALALALASLRGLPTYLDAAQQGGWFTSPPQHVPRRTNTLHLGIIGFGRIGQTLAQLAAPLFASVTFFDPFVQEAPPSASASPAPLSEVVGRSDVLILTVPATSETRGMVDATWLASMPSGALLVNVARGTLVDSVALAAAVANGHLMGAALDVLDEEPPRPDHPLLAQPGILVTPHVGFLSESTMHDYVHNQADNVVRWFAGEPLTTSINGIGKRS